ncbi:MAG: hypothetical protein KAW41_06470 [Candidatus Diapherotrites archaeon]|nr:hypothetical protein [Candidatus Diapherotrites archaeon]
MAKSNLDTNLKRGVGRLMTLTLKNGTVVNGLLVKKGYGIFSIGTETFRAKEVEEYTLKVSRNVDLEANKDNVIKIVPYDETETKAILEEVLGETRARDWFTTNHFTREFIRRIKEKSHVDDTTAKKIMNRCHSILRSMIASQDLYSMKIITPGRAQGSSNVTDELSITHYSRDKKILLELHKERNRPAMRRRILMEKAFTQSMPFLDYSDEFHEKMVGMLERGTTRTEVADHIMSTYETQAMENVRVSQKDMQRYRKKSAAVRWKLGICVNTTLKLLCGKRPKYFDLKKPVAEIIGKTVSPRTGRLSNHYRMK